MKTEPKPRFPKGEKPDPATLTGGRYGTYEMVRIWGPEKTFEYSLRVQGQAAKTLNEMDPEIVPEKEALEIYEKASLKYINPDTIRRIEDETGHDVIAINRSIAGVVSREAAVHINKGKTSADTTQPTKALQFKISLEEVADSAENLRDIIIEKSLEWQDIHFMDTTHLYDALPSTAGRPFAHYAEMLQSNLTFLKFVYNNSIKGKWGDATGNHHSAKALGLDGLKLQAKYCNDLGIGYMIAPGQIPGLEFEADISYVMARMGETLNNIAKFVATGRGDDTDIFVNGSPKKNKGSSAMPHKDAKNGNPTAEEQNMSDRNYLVGNLVTSMLNCDMPYARNLAASSNARINFEDGFKFLDHNIRRLANVVYWLNIKEDKSKGRVLRSYGAPTSQLVMTYLTDQRKVDNPMTREEAHDLMGELATEAWESKTLLYDVLKNNEEVTSRIDLDVLKEITDPLKYIGQAKEIITKVAEKYHNEKTL